MLRHWSQFVPDMSTDNRGQETLHHHHHHHRHHHHGYKQSSGAVWKSRWTSWATVPNKYTVSVDVKQHFNNSGHKRNPFILGNALVNVQLHIPGNPRSVHVSNATTTASHLKAETFWSQKETNKQNKNPNKQKSNPFRTHSALLSIQSPAVVAWLCYTYSYYILAV